jgi:hypothetical protein
VTELLRAHSPASWHGRRRASRRRRRLRLRRRPGRQETIGERATSAHFGCLGGKGGRMAWAAAQITEHEKTCGSPIGARASMRVPNRCLSVHRALQLRAASCRKPQSPQSDRATFGRPRRACWPNPEPHNPKHKLGDALRIRHKFPLTGCHIRPGNSSCRNRSAIA